MWWCWRSRFFIATTYVNITSHHRGCCQKAWAVRTSRYPFMAMMMIIFKSAPKHGPKNALQALDCYILARQICPFWWGGQALILQPLSTFGTLLISKKAITRETPNKKGNLYVKAKWNNKHRCCCWLGCSEYKVGNGVNFRHYAKRTKLNHKSRFNNYNTPK